MITMLIHLGGWRFLVEYNSIDFFYARVAGSELILLRSTKTNSNGTMN